MSKFDDSIRELYTILGIDTEDKRLYFKNLEHLGHLSQVQNEIVVEFANSENSEIEKHVEIMKDAKLG